MNERVISILTKIKETVKKFSAKTKKIIIIGVAASVVLSIGIALWLNNRPYVTLFTGLSNEEASEIMGKLQEDGVDYKYEALSSGSSILVPEDVGEQLKAELVYEGYPKSGFTYDVFSENVDLTSSESEKQYYERQGLQERMGATISSFFPNIKEATVTIAFGEDRKYVLDSENSSKATASVAVITKDGTEISQEDVQAMQRLISRSIPDLEFESVTVVCNGKDVSVTEETSGVNANQLKLQVEEAIDTKIKNKVLDILIPIYGQDRVQVSVKSEVDINKKLRELIDYTAENEDNTGVKSSETAHQEVGKEGEAVGGVPGTETNSDIPVYSAITQDGTENYILSDGTAEYLVDQIKEQQQIDAGDVEDLSIAVIIDDENLDTATRRNLVSLVARAAGISNEDSDDKIEIVGIPFHTEEGEEDAAEADNIPTEEQIRRLVIIGGIAVGALLLLLLIVLIIIKIIKRKRKKQKNKGINVVIPEPASYQEPKQEENVDLVADLINIKNERSMELKNKIREITEENPEISAQTLKAWLRGGDRDGK